MRTLNALRLGGAAVAWAVLLTGCGLVKSPADGLTFAAPYGWQPSTPVGDVARAWISPSGPSESMTLFRFPKELDLNDAAADENFNNTHFSSKQRITICGNQPATYLIGTRTSPDTGTVLNVRAVVTNTNGATYRAIYFYPPTTLPNGEALAALRQLCPAKA